MNNIEVSIVVPCYKQACFLNQSLGSVLGQSFQNWECIVVDDGSPDNTEEVAKEWCAKDARFRYVYKTNGGVCNARNTGIEHAVGKWILPLDADNYLAPDYLRQAVEVMKADNDIGIVYSRAEYFGDKSGEWILPPYRFEDLLLNNMIDTLALYAKEDWKLVGGYDPAMLYSWDDWEFWIHLLSATQKKVYRLDYIGFYYRVKEESRTTDIGSDMSKMKYSEEYILAKHIKVYMQTFGTYKSLLNEQLRWEKKYKDSFCYKWKKFFRALQGKE